MRMQLIARTIAKVVSKPPIKTAAIILSGEGNSDINEQTETISAIKAFNKLQMPYSLYLHTPPVPSTSIKTDYTYIKSTINDLSTLTASKYDMLFIPAGVGLGKNLSSFLSNTADFTINPLLASIVQECYKQKKYIAVTNYAPMLLAKIYNQIALKATLTLGLKSNSLFKEGSKLIKANGHQYLSLKSYEYYDDYEHKIIWTPTYINPKTNECIIDCEVERMLRYTYHKMIAIPNKLHIERAERAKLSAIKKNTVMAEKLKKKKNKISPLQQLFVPYDKKDSNI
jgi:enhancing lycopene biosynthesis protein 2